MPHFKTKDPVTKSLSHYNFYYNASSVRNTSTSRFLQYIQQKRLTDLLEWLEKLGYSDEESVVVLDAAQIVGGAT